MGWKTEMVMKIISKVMVFISGMVMGFTLGVTRGTQIMERIANFFVSDLLKTLI